MCDMGRTRWEHGGGRGEEGDGDGLGREWASGNGRGGVPERPYMDRQRGRRLGAAIHRTVHQGTERTESQDIHWAYQCSARAAGAQTSANNSPRSPPADPRLRSGARRNPLAAWSSARPRTTPFALGRRARSCARPGWKKVTCGSDLGTACDGRLADLTSRSVTGQHDDGQTPQGT